MIVSQHVPTSKMHVHPLYALGLLFLLVTVQADLNGIDACQNRCFNQSECNEVGNGLCCQWDGDVGQCRSSIGQDTCLGTATMPPPLSKSIACTRSAVRSLSESEAEESTPTTSPTKYHERSPDYFCENRETWLDWYLCQGHGIARLTALIINYKISSTLSILGSGYVIQDVLRDPRKRNESTYHRIMLGLSCSDILISFFYAFMGSWLMPKGSQLFAVGSKVTCGISAFFTSMAAPVTPLYNCSLTTFYFLKLRLSWANRKIKAIEKWLLFLPCTLGLASATSSAAMNKLGPYGYSCTSLFMGFWYVYMAVLGLSLCYVSITMFLVFRAVYNVEKQAEKYTFAKYTKSNKNTMGMSRRIMIQGILYSAVLFSQCTPFFLIAFVKALNSSYTIEILNAIFFPLQGFLNALIYMIPLFQKLMKKRRESKQKKMSNSVPILEQTRKPSILPPSAAFFISKASKTTSHSESILHGPCKQGDVLDCDSELGVSKEVVYPSGKIDVNSKQQEETSESKTGEEAMILGDIKGLSTKTSNTQSPLFYIDEEKQEESESFKNSGLKTSGGKLSRQNCSQIASEADLGVFENIENEDDNSDDEDDYLKMMEN